VIELRTHEYDNLSAFGWAQLTTAEGWTNDEGPNAGNEKNEEGMYMHEETLARSNVAFVR